MSPVMDSVNVRVMNYIDDSLSLQSIKEKTSQTYIVSVLRHIYTSRNNTLLGAVLPHISTLLAPLLAPFVFIEHKPPSRD